MTERLPLQLVNRSQKRGPLHSLVGEGAGKREVVPSDSFRNAMPGEVDDEERIAWPRRRQGGLDTLQGAADVGKRDKMSLIGGQGKSEFGAGVA